jgi:hypothetical protein
LTTAPKRKIAAPAFTRRSLHPVRHNSPPRNLTAAVWSNKLRLKSRLIRSPSVTRDFTEPGENSRSTGKIREFFDSARSAPKYLVRNQ